MADPFTVAWLPRVGLFWFEQEGRITDLSQVFVVLHEEAAIEFGTNALFPCLLVEKPTHSGELDPHSDIIVVIGNLLVVCPANTCLADHKLADIVDIVPG